MLLLITTDFFVNEDNLKKSNVFQKISSSCIATCHDKYTDEDGNKIKGRGWCKAACWLETAAKVAAAIAAIIVAT